LFSMCMLGGTLTDAWAHVNRLGTLEGFFTPWHALLYSGVMATSGWTFWLAYRRRGHAPRWWRDGWPAGYRLGAVGAPLLGAGAVGDMIWHEVLGVEASLEAVLSPTHLVLLVGAVLLLSSPLRSWWSADAPGGMPAAIAVASLVLTTTAVSAFVMYASAFLSVAPTRPYDGLLGTPSANSASLGFASYLVTTMLLVVPLLMVYRWRAVPGTATGLVRAVALFAMVTFEFPMPQAAGA